MRLLPRRLEKVATFLATGETIAAAKRFKISQGRISQIRKELFLVLQQFRGNQVGLGGLTADR